jgi:hypothetical protein
LIKLGGEVAIFAIVSITIFSVESCNMNSHASVRRAASIESVCAVALVAS